MSFMEAALEGYKAPEADDMEIVLPPRREPKKEPAAAEPRDLGQHGGAADGSPAANETHADVVSGNATSATEPAPQRDEPDDGEHTDSTEQDVAARAQQAAAQAAAEEEAPAGAAEVPEPDLDAERLPEPEATVAPVVDPVQAAKDAKKVLASIAGNVPATFQKMGFSSGGAETVLVKRFPVPLVDRLRLSLAATVGGTFAEAMSAPALITAFLIAKTGVDLDVDANTALAVDVFRQVDPRLLAVEDKINGMVRDIGQLTESMSTSENRIRDSGHITDGLEFAMAYLIADRVAGLTTTDTDETNVDVTQKKVLVARERIRTRAKDQRLNEKNRAARSTR